MVPDPARAIRQSIQGSCPTRPFGAGNVPETYARIRPWFVVTSKEVMRSPRGLTARKKGGRSGDRRARGGIAHISYSHDWAMNVIHTGSAMATRPPAMEGNPLKQEQVRPLDPGHR